MGSGHGHHMSGGVQGFARAGLVGGIPHLLASKWNILAKESIFLMTRIYAFMASNKAQGADQTIFFLKYEHVYVCIYVCVNQKVR